MRVERPEVRELKEKGSYEMYHKSITEMRNELMRTLPKF